MRLKATFIALLFFSIGHSRSIDFIPIESIEEWTEIFSICRKTDMPILVFIAPYDINRNKTQRQQFSDKKLSKLVNQNMVSLEVSASSELGENLVQLYGIEDGLCFMFFANVEIALLKKEGYQSSNKLIKFINQGLRRNTEYTQLIDHYEKNTLSKKEWIDYLLIHQLNFGYGMTIDEANRFMLQLTDADLSDTLIWNYILNFGIDINHPVYQTIYKDPTIVENEINKFPWEEFYKNAYNLNLFFAINNQDSIRIDKMKKELIPIFPDSTKLDLQTLRLDQQYFGALKKWKSYKEVTDSFYADTPADSSNLFYNEALIVYESYLDKGSENLALYFLDKGIELKPTYELHNTKSLIYYYQGNSAAAIKEAELAYKYNDNPSKSEGIIRFIDYMIYGY